MTTAIQRNITNTPRLICSALYVALYMGYMLLIPWSINIALVFISSGFWAIIALYLSDRLCAYLIRMRLESWAEEMRGIHSDDLDFFLGTVDPVELDRMVAADFEGWGEECEFGGPDDESK